MRLGGGVGSLKTAAWLAEKAGRVKFNDQHLAYSDLSHSEELEGLLPGVRGKLALWMALAAALAAGARFGDVDSDDPIRGAKEKLGEIVRHRLRSARQAFSPDAPLS